MNSRATPCNADHRKAQGGNPKGPATAKRGGARPLNSENEILHRRQDMMQPGHPMEVAGLLRFEIER